MKKKIIFLALTLLLVFGVVQVASAAGWGWAGAGGHPTLNSNNWQSPVSALGLSDQQAAQMQELQKNMYDKTRDLRIKLMDTTFELRQLGLQKNVDQAAVDAKIKELNDLRSQLNNERQQNRQQLQSILTPEQLSKIGSKKGLGFGGPRQGFGRCGFGGGPVSNGQAAPPAAPAPGATTQG